MPLSLQILVYIYASSISALMDDENNPDKWVNLYADYLYAFAIKRISDQELAKDLVQDTFLSALKNLDGYKEVSSVRTWLTAILKNKIIDTYRKKSALRLPDDRNSSGDYSDDFFEENGHWRKPHYPEPWNIENNTSVERKEFQNILKACMERLPGLWASVFSMKHLDDDDSDKICKELRLTSSNFWVIMHRTKLSLRSCMEKNWLN